MLTTVRPISDLSELYFQFSEYRLEILEERIRNQLSIVRESYRGSKKFDTKAMKEFLTEQEDFIRHMDQQIIPNELVKKGEIDDSHLFSNFNQKSKKRKLSHEPEKA